MFLRKRSGIKRHWTRLYKKSLAELNELIDSDYPSQNWDANVSPDGTASFEFKTAVRILAGSEDWDLARRYLTRSVALVDRVFKEDKLMQPGCKLRYPENSAICRKTKAYAEALLGGELDRDALIVASREYQAYFEERDDPKDRNEQRHYSWVASIQLALIGGDLERSGQLLKRSPSHSRLNKRHLGALKDLAALASAAVRGPEAQGLVERFDAFFDLARDPRRSMEKGEFLPVTTGPFELALLRERYVHRNSGSVDWVRVIADYSADA